MNARRCPNGFSFSSSNPLTQGCFFLRVVYCIYNAFITLCWPLFFLYYFVRSHSDGKYRSNYLYRLGLKLPPALPSSRRVWFHALSVGEALSVAPLVRTLKRMSPDIEIVFSTKTATGQAIASARLSRWVNTFLYLPIDFPLVTNSLVRRLKPSVFVLVETEIWPNLLRSLKSRGVFIALVNGRIAQRSFERFETFWPFVTPLFKCFDAVFAQTSEDKHRFEKLGAKEDRVHAVGNLKFDSSLGEVAEPEIAAMRQETGIEADRPVWIAGSTHAGEEKLLAAVHQSLRKEYPHLLLILAPRDVKRTLEIGSICSAQGLAVVTRTGKQSAKGKGVYLLDTMGELSKFYALADIAFIGGSLVPFGGHNPLEAVAKLKAALWGPYLWNFSEIEKALLDAECGFRVASAVELENVLKQWLSDLVLRSRMESNARHFLESRSGSSEKIARFLVETPLNSVEILPKSLPL